MHFSQINGNHNFDKRISNAKDNFFIFGEFLKLYFQISFEENLKIIL